MSHTPAPVATTNLMRTVGALSTTTQGCRRYIPSGCGPDADRAPGIWPGG